jgi:hypothetical protein
VADYDIIVTNCDGGSREKTWECRMNQKHAIKRTADGHPTPEYDAWHAMRGRCNNPNRSDYHLYGGRGIRCDLTFEEFFAEVGPRPSARHYLVHKNGHYAKGNIKWEPLRNGGEASPSPQNSGCSINSDRFWHAQIAVAARGQSLGRYANEEEAALAYDEAARRYHGPGAVCNFPQSHWSRNLNAGNRQTQASGLPVRTKPPARSADR